METIVNSGNCTQAQLIYTNVFFILTQFILIVVNVIGIVFCTCISLFVITSQVFHLNLRILLINMYIAMALRTICTTSRSSRNIWMAFAYSTPCDYLVSRQQCTVLSTLCAAPLPIIMYSFLAIAVERILALIFYAKYEHFNIPLAAIVLTPTTWVKTITEMIPLFTSIASTIPSIVYCSSIVATHTFDFKRLLDFTVPLLVFSAIAFVIIYVICKAKLRLHLSRGVQNLSARYQLRENIRSTKLFAFLSAIYTSIMIINIVSYGLLAAANAMDLRTVAILKEASALISVPIFMPIWSILFLRMVPFLRQRVARFVFRTSSAHSHTQWTSSTTLSTAKHLTILNATWISKSPIFNSKVGV